MILFLFQKYAIYDPFESFDMIGPGKHLYMRFMTLPLAIAGFQILSNEIPDRTDTILLVVFFKLF